MITSFHPRFFLNVEAPLFCAQPQFADFLSAMDGGLRGDGRFHELKWYESKDAPDPWESEPSPDGPTAAELSAAGKERIRRAQREKRRTNWGCLIAVASAVVLLIGAMETIQGTVFLLVNGVVGGQLVMGVLILLVGGLGFWALHRLSKVSRGA